MNQQPTTDPHNGPDAGAPPARRLVRITYRDGSTEDLEPTMGAMAYAEMQGLNPLSSAVGYMCAIAWRLKTKAQGTRGIPASWMDWAEDPSGPVMVEYVTVEDDDSVDPTDGLPASP